MSLTLSEHFYMCGILSVYSKLRYFGCQLQILIQKYKMVNIEVKCEKNECNDNHGACI